MLPYIFEGSKFCGFRCFPSKCENEHTAIAYACDPRNQNFNKSVKL